MRIGNVRRLGGAILTVAACCAAPAAEAPPEPWVDEAPLALPAGQVASAAAAFTPTDPEADHLTLLEEHTYRIDAEGRARTSYRSLGRVLTRAGADGYTVVGTSWRPWFGGKPDLRARVITASGVERLLDPGSIEVIGASNESPSVFDDVQTIRAPLPGVEPGAIVEWTTSGEDREPFFGTGVVVSFPLGAIEVESVRRRIVVEAPVEVPLNWTIVGATGATPAVEERDGIRRLVLDLPRTPAFPEPEHGMPNDAVLVPWLFVSTGRSWNHVAKAYDDLVEEALRAADVKTIAKEATRGIKDEREKILAVLARLHGAVRYTGVEFGDRALVPASPRETLDRGYGDCKDKGILLVALLRAIGLDARAALVSVGTGGDVPPDLPGLGVFNHLIVHVRGKKPLWIDPTAEFHGIEFAPDAVQGRLALVIAPDTQALVPVPEAPSAANVEREVREIALADHGAGRIVETSLPSGSIEANYRSIYRGLPDSEIRERLEPYVRGAYSARAFERFEVGKADDLREPFTIVVEATGIGTALTDTAEAAVAVPVATFLSPLSTFASDEEETAEKEARREPFAWETPFVREWVYRIRPPDGFEPATLPEDRTRSFGPATFTQTTVPREDGVLEATFRLDTGKRRWTAAEFEEARKAYDEEGNPDPLVFSFEHAGERLLEHGEIREALARFRAEEARRPASAIPKTRIARALLAAGIGAGARETAEAAVRAEPESVVALSTRGWVLQHDAIGRRFGHGWDREGALASYRKAAALEPENTVVAADLAILLEHDGEGNRYVPGPDLDEAISIYRRLRDELGDHDFDGNLLAALGRVERFEEVKALATEMEDSAVRNGWLLASRAALGDASSAVRSVSSLVKSPEERSAALTNAGGILMVVRRYDAAALFFSAAAAGMPDAVQRRGFADWIGKIRRHESVSADRSDPRFPVLELYRTAALGELDPETVAPWFVEDLRPDPDALEALLSSMKSTVRRTRAQLRTAGLSGETLADAILTHIELKPEGLAEGEWRIRSSMTALGSSVSESYFVVDEGQGPRIVGTGEEAATLARYAARRIEAGEMEKAARWLDRARELTGEPGAGDPFWLSANSTFAAVWKKDGDRSPDEARFAAAVLLSPDASTSEIAMRLLESLPPSEDGLTRARLDRARIHCLWNTERYEEAETLARDLKGRFPDSKYPSLYLLESLRLRRNYEELLREASAFLETYPDQASAMRNAAGAEAYLGRREEHEARLEAILAKGLAIPADRNNLAWSYLVSGRKLDRALDLAREAVRAEPDNVAALHTLSAILAEVGRIAEAKEAMVAVRDLQESDELEDAEWYLVGRIAEQVGEREIARRAYGRLSAPDDEAMDPGSPWYLAQRRLKALGT